MKQHWLVAPIDIKRDERKGNTVIVTPNRPGAVPNADQGIEELLAEAPPIDRFANAARRIQAGGPRPRDRGDADQWGNPVGTEYGFVIHADTKREMDQAFTHPDLAMKHAQDLAAKHPGVQYGVFACVGVFETTTPTIIRKKFNDGGELVLETQE